MTQEVLIKLTRSFDGFKGKSKLSTWIYRIATNTALDRLRSSSYRQDRNLIAEDELIAEDQTAYRDDKVVSMDQRVIEDEMNSCIRNVIDGLPENYRAVLTLSELEDFKNRKIAEILGITLESVKINLHRARSRLRKELEHRCEFYRTEKSELACEPAEPTPENRK